MMPIINASAPLWRASTAFFCEQRGQGIFFPFLSSSSVNSGASTLLPCKCSYSLYVISLISLKIYVTMYPTRSTKSTYIYLNAHCIHYYSLNVWHYIPQEGSPWDQEICSMHIIVYLPQSLGAWPPPPPPCPRSLDHWCRLVITSPGSLTPSLLKLY